MADKYYVAKGKAISCKRGIVVEGEEICKEDLATPENFELLIKSEKKLLTKTVPELPKKGVIEMPMQKKESKQEVQLSDDSKKDSKKSSPDAGAKKK